MENKVKLELMSKSSNEAFARIAIAAFVSQLDPTKEEIADIKTAVSEAESGVWKMKRPEEGSGTGEAVKGAESSQSVKYMHLLRFSGFLRLWH